MAILEETALGAAVLAAPRFPIVCLVDPLKNDRKPLRRGDGDDTRTHPFSTRGKSCYQSTDGHFCKTNWSQQTTDTHL